MSRSRKKHAVYTDFGRNYTPWAKRQANKAVRRYKGEIQNGNSYKKIFPSWDIHDWRIYYSESEIGISFGGGNNDFIPVTQEDYNKVKRK